MKITRLLLEDILKTYWVGDIPIVDYISCKEDGHKVNTLVGVAKHMRKEHKVFTARRGSKRSLYHSHNILPESNSENWYIRLPENYK